MVESKFPDDFPAALQLHPETKEQIEPTAIMPLTEANLPAVQYCKFLILSMKMSSWIAE